MATDLVLAVTVGQRDLQLLAVGPSGLVRVSPARDTIGALHRALLGGQPHRLWLPDVSPAEDRKADAAWRNGRLHFSAGLRQAVAADLPTADAASDNTLWLVPGLLADPLRNLESEHAAGTIVLQRVLLFHTDRGPDDRFAVSEPVAAAPLLARLLCNRIPSLGNAAVEIVNVLGPGEELTERDRFENTVLRTAAAQRIDTALRRAAGLTPGATLRLYLSGGIPAVGPVVEASARFRFDHVEARGPDEFAPAAAAPAAPPVSAVETLHARRRVRDLVGEGQFASAALLAETVASGQPWTQGLRAVAHYLQGYRDRAKAALPALAGQHTAAWLSVRLGATDPNCLLVAFRAEAALRAGDVCTGAQLTGTFLDVAVFDTVERHLSGAISAVDWASVCAIGKRLNLRQADLDQIGRPLYTGYRPDGIFCKKPWLDDWLDDWDELRFDQKWQKWLVAEAVRNQAGTAALGSYLQRLVEQFYSRTGRGLVPAYFRNTVIHSLPPNDAQVQQHRDLFAARGLWHHGGGQRYSVLHPETWPAKVLSAFGIADPLGLYEDGSRAVTADLEAAPLP